MNTKEEFHASAALTKRIVEALKMRFPEPYFCDWRIRKPQLGAGMGHFVTACVHAASVPQRVGNHWLIKPAAAMTMEALLELVEAIPIPAPLPPGALNHGAPERRPNAK